MTDSPDNTTGPREPDDTTDPEADRRPPSDGPTTGPETAEKMLHYAQWIAFGFLVLVALVAAIRLYIAASATIETFVVRRYRPLFVLGFNLVVVLGCGIGISALVRRLT